MSLDIKKKIEHLRNEIVSHDYRYYVLSQPSISDKEYDDLMRALGELEQQYPQYKTDDSPTMRVSGGVIDGFLTVAHRQKMLSLDNTYSFDEVRDWTDRVARGLGATASVEYVVELKIDGVSANLMYERGKLTVGATRGDGQNGEDVTANIKTIRAIPLSLRGKDLPEFIEVRGEVYMETGDFALINKARQAQGLELFANPRNATSGSLKLLDTALVSKRKLNFFAHSLGAYKGKAFSTHWDYLIKLKEWGLRSNPHAQLCGSIDEVIAFCQEWEGRRKGIIYQTDGIVIKVNDLGQQKRLGSTLKSPRWAAAYKYPAHQATTDVLNITANVGRTGIITPVAVLAPVECAGVTIQHATLHNFDEIKRLKIRVGDRVLIERAGEVIPKVVKVVTRRGKEDVLVPLGCPACGEKVIKEKEEDVAYRCINSSCPAQLERRLLHFASRHALDIQGFGEAVVQQLVKLRLVNDFADIYKLEEEDLAKLELFKEKKIKNLLLAIQESKKKPLSRLLFALGIRHVGEKAAYLLAQRFKSLDVLARAKKEDLDSIYEVGSVMADSVVDYFFRHSTKKLIAELKGAGVNFRETTAQIKVSVLSGKTIVFTGEMGHYSRIQAEELARGLGAHPVSSVSKNTDLVVAGAHPGSKVARAKKIGIKIITEAEFRAFIQAG